MSMQFNGRWIRTVAIGWFVLGLVWAPVAFSQQSSLPARVWRSADRSESVEATLVDYAPDDRVVTLESTDGRTLTIPLKFLSSSDRRYVRAWRKRQASASSTAPSVESDEPSDQEVPAAAEDKADDKAVARIRRSKARLTNLYGIRWAPDMTAALEIAQGGDGTRDDRPVMWFRVLGDLQGPM